MKNQYFKWNIIVFILVFSLSGLIWATESLNISYIDFMDYDDKDLCHEENIKYSGHILNKSDILNGEYIILMRSKKYHL